MDALEAHDAIMAIGPSAMDAPPTRAALRDGPSHARLWLFAGVGLALDLWSKSWAFAHLDPAMPEPVWPGWLEFRRSLNPGAVFGLGPGQVKIFIVASLVALAFVFFLFATSSRRQWLVHCALGMILGGATGNFYDRLFIKADVLELRSVDGPNRVFVGTVLSNENGTIELGSWPDGAALETRIDAHLVADLRTQGVVRDFIKIVPSFPAWMPYLGSRSIWPWVFNVADALLVTGVLVLMLYYQGPGRRHGRWGAASVSTTDEAPGAVPMEPQKNGGNIS